VWAKTHEVFHGDSTGLHVEYSMEFPQKTFSMVIPCEQKHMQTL